MPKLVDQAASLDDNAKNNKKQDGPLDALDAPLMVMLDVALFGQPL
jgi:hypothetical protein